MNKNSFMYLGKEYENVNQLANAYELNIAQLSSYIEKYNGVTEAMEKALSTKENRKVYVYGKPFNHLGEVALFYGVKRAHLGHFIYEKGMTVEKAIETIQSKEIVYKGKNYASLSLLCDEYGIDTKMVRRRLGKGWELEKALEEPIKTTMKNNVHYRDQVFDSQNELLRHYGITVDFVKSVMKLYGLDWDMSFDCIVSFLETCKGNRPHTVSRIPYVIYNEIWFKGIEDFSQYLGVTKRAYDVSLKKTENRNPLQVVKILSGKTVSRYQYKRQEYTSKELIETVGSSFKGLEKKGEIQKITIPKHPNIPLPNGYCKETAHDFKNYMESKLETIS